MLSLKKGVGVVMYCIRRQIFRLRAFPYVTKPFHLHDQYEEWTVVKVRVKARSLLPTSYVLFLTINHRFVVFLTNILICSKTPKFPDYQHPSIIYVSISHNTPSSRCTFLMFFSEFMIVIVIIIIIINVIVVIVIKPPAVLRLRQSVTCLSSRRPLLKARQSHVGFYFILSPNTSVFPWQHSFTSASCSPMYY